MDYPKWIKEGEHIGPVLVISEEDEAQTRAIWASRNEPQEEKEPPKRGRPRKSASDSNS